ncbi:hypothetical protein ACH0CA_01230 [Kytococcus sedentarius]|uniref:hypothetical protein n=1 Tax=Kytococcus sedentarius TaxID=1276 RepID=UPI003879155E
MSETHSPDFCPVDGGPRIGTTCGTCAATLVFVGVEYPLGDAPEFLWTENGWARFTATGVLHD